MYKTHVTTSFILTVPLPFLADSSSIRQHVLPVLRERTRCTQGLQAAIQSRALQTGNCAYPHIHIPLIADDPITELQCCASLRTCSCTALSGCGWIAQRALGQGFAGGG